MEWSEEVKTSVSRLWTRTVAPDVNIIEIDLINVSNDKHYVVRLIDVQFNANEIKQQETRLLCILVDREDQVN